MTDFLTQLEAEIKRHARNHAGHDARARADTPRFDIEPMPLDRWLRDPAMMGGLTLSEIQYRTVEHAERVLYPETYAALGWLPVRLVNDVVCAFGKGSGKGFCSRIILARIIYQLLCLESPQEYFSMPSHETISVMNTAVAAPQAKSIFFDPFVEYLRHSRWFSPRMAAKSRTIEFEKNLMAISGHSNVESLEGTNSIAVVLDELSGFKSVSEIERQRRLQDREPSQSAEGIYRMARSSVISRFPDTGKVISLSYTRFRNDAIDTLVKRGQLDNELLGSESRWFVSRAATWEVNPLRRRSDFDAHYREDPEDAQCRYECRPMLSPHRFFKNLLAVRRALGAPLAGIDYETFPPRPTILIDFEYGPDHEGIESWTPRFDFSHLDKHRHPLAIHLDLAVRHDRAGVAASHVAGWRDVEFETVDDSGRRVTQMVRKPVVVTDFVITFEALTGDAPRDIPPSDIQIRWARDLILALMKVEGFVVGLCTADGYNSIDTLQLLTSQGIKTGLYSLDRTTEGFDTLKAMIMDGTVSAPWDPLLYAEIEALTKVSATKVDHQAGGSKDAADAWAGSVVGAVKLAEQGGGDFDGWSGGSFEQIARAHVDEAANELIDHQIINFYSQGAGADAYEEYLSEFDIKAHERSLRDGSMTPSGAWPKRPNLDHEEF